MPDLTDFHTEAELERKRIGVLAAETDPTLEPLLAALQQIYPVLFVQIDAGAMQGIDAAVVLDPGLLAETRRDIPRLVLARAARGGSAPKGDAREGDVRAGGAHEGGAAIATVVLLDDERLPRALRGRSIAEEAACGELESPPAAERAVLASVDRSAVWWQELAADAPLAFSAYPLMRLRAGEALREHLRAGRFMGLLPLVHFLGQVLGDAGWTLPPLRASFVIDDPNLHWPSYGFLAYRELAAHAGEHGYHVGLATIPLDGWLVNRRSAAIVRDNPATLSLLIHGNDHVARELGRLQDDREAQPAIAQALRRIVRLERRTGIAVQRVMAPPHGACSEAALRAMFRLGIEGACISRPYPWRDGLPAPTPLAGWHPAELVAGGLPILPRYPLGHPRDDLALRALLGQPLILYGHHQDFADGLDLFAQAASAVNGLGDVQWGPLGWIARGNYATRQVHGTLHVEMHARRIALEVPADVQTLRVRMREPFGGAAWQRLEASTGDARTAEASESFAMRFDGSAGVSEGRPVAAPASIELRLLADHPLDAALLAPPRPRPWPLLRRALVEGRDRLQPLRHAVELHDRT
ncbi:MAG TPA: hypothetical protein VGL37_02415 [Solirubrobacteraceae bacterium]|jgi:hypothetical protein